MAQTFQQLQADALGPKTAANYPSPAALRAAQCNLDDSRLQKQVHQAALELAEARLESLKLRIAAADDGPVAGLGDAEQTARHAIASERQVDYMQALHASLVAEQGLIQAERQLADVPADKTDQVEAAKKVVTTATATVQASRAAIDATRAKLNTIDGKHTPLSPEYPKQSTGRRTALARWLTAEENPLTARVAVNHLWMRHFGAPLVETVDNFGIQGKSPTHPELLDWLAVELMRQNWSMKAIHRLIVTSQFLSAQFACRFTRASQLQSGPR